MNDNIEGVEVEARRFFGGAAENNNSRDDSIDQLPDTNDDIESDLGAPSNQQGKQPNNCSNIKFYLLLFATFGVFLGVGIGEYGIVYSSLSSWGLIPNRDIRYA